jgi:hypothetical protein
MIDKVTEFTGDIPLYYDRGMGPVMFADFAGDMARRVASVHPMRVLEFAAGPASSPVSYAIVCPPARA